MVLFVVCGYLILKNKAQLWDLESLDRHLIDCENNYLNEKQGRYNDSLKRISVPLDELVEPQLPFDEILYQVDYSDVYQPAPVEVKLKEPKKEPICVDWVGWGDDITCIKWQ